MEPWSPQGHPPVSCAKTTVLQANIQYSTYTYIQPSYSHRVSFCQRCKYMQKQEQELKVTLGSERWSQSRSCPVTTPTVAQCWWNGYSLFLEKSKQSPTLTPFPLCTSLREKTGVSFKAHIINKMFHTQLKQWFLWRSVDSPLWST